MNVEQMNKGYRIMKFSANLFRRSKFLVHLFDIPLVRMEGLEPPRLAASDPKSEVSANSTTSGRRKSQITNSKSQTNLKRSKLEFGIWNLEFVISFWVAKLHHLY